MKLNWKNIKKSIPLYSAVLIVLGIALYGLLSNFSQNYVKEKENALNYAVEHCEGYFSQAWNSAVDLDSAVKGNTFNIENQYNTMYTYNYISSRLGQIISTELWADNAALYIHTDNSVLQVDGSSALSTFYSDVMHYENMELTDFRRAINEADGMTVYRSEKIRVYNETSPTSLLTIMFPLPVSEAGKKATLMLFTREYNFISQFSGIFDENSSFCLVDSDFQKLIDGDSDYGVSEETMRQFVQKNPEGKVAGWREGRTEYVSYWKRSAYNNMMYFVTVTDPSVYARVSKTKFRFFIYMGFILMILILATILFKKMKKREMEKYIERIKSGNGISVDTEDELLYGIIKYMFGNEIQGHDFSPVSKSSGSEQLLLRAVLGNVRDKSYEEIAGELNLFGIKTLRVFVAEVLWNTANEDLYDRLVLRIRQGLCVDGSVRTANYMAEGKYIILVYSEEGQGGLDREKTEAICEELSEILAELNAGEFMLAAGSCRTEFSQVTVSYIDALTALGRNHNEKGENTVIYDEESLVRSGADGLCCADRSDALITAMEQGSGDTVGIIAEGIIKEIKDEYSSFLISKMQCYNLVGQVVRYAASQGCNVEKSRVERILMYQKLDDFEKDFVKLCCDLCDTMSENKNRQQKLHLEKFVSENFCSNTFSLSDIAEEFSLSQTYASIFFKNLMGDTFLNYITKLRMEKIKHLLRTTDMKIKDIVSSCGYIDISNFSRKFKATENMLLSEYRKEFRVNEQKTESFGDDAGDND